MLWGLQVDAAKMRRNLDLTGGLIVAEAVMMGLAPELGRQRAHDVVYDACRIAIESERTLYSVLPEDEKIRQAFDNEKLHALTDPSNYLGAAADMARAVAGATSIRADHAGHRAAD